MNFKSTSKNKPTVRCHVTATTTAEKQSQPSVSSSVKWRDSCLIAVTSGSLNSYFIKVTSKGINTQQMRPTAHCPTPWFVHHWFVRFNCLLIHRQEVAKQSIRNVRKHRAAVNVHWAFVWGLSWGFPHIISRSPHICSMTLTLFHFLTQGMQRTRWITHLSFGLLAPPVRPLWLLLLFCFWPSPPRSPSHPFHP